MKNFNVSHSKGHLINLQNEKTCIFLTGAGAAHNSFDKYFSVTHKYNQD
jgi:hypothetical protein